MKIKSFARKVLNKLFRQSDKSAAKKYNKKYRKHAFVGGIYRNERQFEAQIIKMYHSIEKGLSYPNYRPGFGRDNVEQLLSALEQYAKEYDTSAFFYETALCTLHEYIKKNKAYGHEDADLEKRVFSLSGKANECGGILEFNPPCFDKNGFDFAEFVKSRHSLREFSDTPADLDAVKQAVELSQYTPSACNRQGWKTRIVRNPEQIRTILKNQNGNRGFGEKISTLLVVTGDLRCFSRGRETHQVFIDGGMYAMNLLHSLHGKGLATIPLSASLLEEQEINVKAVLGIDDAEVLIMFIGVGNYPEHCVTTRSERKPCDVTIFD